MRDYVEELERHGVETYGDRGRENVSVTCPFHGDDDVCAEVHKFNGVFHCFKCKKTTGFVEFLAESLDIDADTAGRRVNEFVMPDVSDIERGIFGEDDESDEVKYYSVKSFHKTFRSVIGTEGEEYLRGRGITRASMKWFDVRYGESDEWTDRVILPVYNEEGKLLTWTGRLVYEPVRNEPKTRKPSSGRSALYGLWEILRRAPGKQPYLILVEGEIDSLYMQQLGFRAVSTMGTSSLTDDQTFLLYRYSKRTVFSYDNDPAGRLATTTGLSKVIKLMPTYNVRLPKGCDPNDLDKAQLKNIYKGMI